MLTQREKTLCRLALSMVGGATGLIATIAFDAPLWFVFVLTISYVGVWLIGMFEGGMSMPPCNKEHART